MKILRKLLAKIRRFYYLYVYTLLPAKKLRVECPFCKWSARKFLPFGVKKRYNALCPKCGSLERHRLYYFFLKKYIDPDQYARVLHFAPEKILEGLFKSYDNLEYISADIDPSQAMVKQDITNLSFPDNSFDLIFCSHVLEHIENDRKAMSEILRVLKPGSTAIIQVPLYNIENTFEDYTINTPSEREKKFGQWNHVRMYGKDFVSRLEESGFSVIKDDFYKTLSDEIHEKHSLKKESINLCTKPS